MKTKTVTTLLSCAAGALSVVLAWILGFHAEQWQFWTILGINLIISSLGIVRGWISRGEAEGMRPW